MKSQKVVDEMRTDLFQRAMLDAVSKVKWLANKGLVATLPSLQLVFPGIYRNYFL